MITTLEELQTKQHELETLPEDWYVDMDGSYADRPNQWAIEQAIAVAKWAMDWYIVVEDIDADANGGTCIDLRNEDYREVSIYFRNSKRTSVVARGKGGWSSMLLEDTWARIKDWLKGERQ